MTQSDQSNLQVPMSTARQITEAREHLHVASKELVTAARVIKPYSEGSSVIALHISQQVIALSDRITELLDGLEVVGSDGAPLFPSTADQVSAAAARRAAQIGPIA